MSLTIRCPNRVDFLKAVDANLIKNTTDDDDDDDNDIVDDVPAYLNTHVLDAMDRVSDSDELRAIVSWMDAVRSRHGYATSITDMDVNNGVAMLQTLSVVAPEAFIVDGSVVTDAAAVQTHLDEQGDAARENVRRVCAALRRFPWHDGSGEGGMLLTVGDAVGVQISPYPFERVDA